MSEYNNLGQELTKEQSDYFRHSKIRDDKGRLVVCYHGTTTPGFKEFSSQSSDKSQFGNYKFKKYNVNYFTYSKETARGYTKIGVEDEEEGNIYYCYLNITNPYVVDNTTTAEYKTWKNIIDKQIKRRELELWSKFEDFVYDMRYDGYDVNKINGYLFYFNYELRESKKQSEDYDTFYDLIKLGNNSMWGQEHPIMSQYTLEELFEDEDNFQEMKEEIIWPEEEREDKQYTTDDIVRWVIWMNEYEHTDYDGIVLNDIFDEGPTGSLFGAKTTDVVTIKSSNQIKYISNPKPTSSNRIDEDKINNLEQKLIDKLKSLGYKFTYLKQGWYDENTGKEISEREWEDKEEPEDNWWYRENNSHLFKKDNIEFSWDIDESNKIFKIITLWSYTGAKKGEATKLLDEILNMISNNWTIEIEDNINNEYWKYIKDRYSQFNWRNINESLNDINFRMNTCGYIEQDGNIIYLKEYHGEDEILRDKKLIEFSNTHPEEDTCIRIFTEPTKEQYNQLEKIIDKYLDIESYCKIEINNDFYKIFSLYEDACEMYGIDEIVGNWTGYKLIQQIKNYFIKKESLNNITEKLSVNRQEIIKTCERELGTSDTPVKGPSYIMPDGKFLKIIDSNINIKGMSGGQSYSGESQHLDVDGWLERRFKEQSTSPYDIGSYYLGEDCIRVNSFDIEHFVVLTVDRPNDTQLNSLLDWLYYLSSIRKDVIVMDNYGSWLNQKTYRFSETLPEEIIKKIKKYYSSGKSITSRTLEEKFEWEIKTNKHIQDLITECIITCKECGFTDYNYDKITWKDMDSTKVLGQYNHNECTIFLSKHILNDKDDSIKSTILHELAHFIDYQWCIKKSYIVYEPFKGWCYNDRYNVKNEILGHKKHWKEVAKTISNYTNLDIEREGESVGADEEERKRSKYIVKCNNCGTELFFQKKSSFVKNPNVNKYDEHINGKDSWYWVDYYEKHPDIVARDKKAYVWQCGDCGKSGQWTVIENK